jgi:hypothetical protein
MANGINGACMAKAKRSKARENLLRWRVSLIKGTPAKFVDFTLAPDAETAERQVAEAHEIRKDLRDRLVAIRED